MKKKNMWLLKGFTTGAIISGTLMGVLALVDRIRLRKDLEEILNDGNRGGSMPENVFTWGTYDDLLDEDDDFFSGLHTVEVDVSKFLNAFFSSKGRKKLKELFAQSKGDLWVRRMYPMGHADWVESQKLFKNSLRSSFDPLEGVDYIDSESGEEGIYPSSEESMCDNLFELNKDEEFNWETVERDIDKDDWEDTERDTNKK